MAMMDPMAAQMPPQDPSMMAAIGQGMPSEEDIILQLLQATMGKWGVGEQIIAGEKNALIETLMMLAQSQPAAPQQMFTEGGPMPTEPPMVDPSMGY